MIFGELLQGINGGKVLDVGCGSGQFMEILTQSLKSFESVTGIDVDETILREARMNLTGDAFRFITASSQSLPFEEGSFDFVSISKTLHHVENDRQTIAEMMRVLKPGGFVLINEMIRDGLSESQQSHMHYHHLRAEIDNLIGISHGTTYYRSNLLELIHSVGLKDLSLTEHQPQEPAPKNPSNIAEYIEKMTGWLEEIADHPLYEDYEKRMAVLQEHFQKYGISWPTQIIALGKKT